MPPRLPPTTDSLLDPSATPYFVWWTPCTVADLRRHLASPDPDERAYWLGALLREANSRDVWLFTTADRIREAWPRILPHLARARERWAWILGMPAELPPAPR